MMHISKPLFKHTHSVCVQLVANVISVYAAGLVISLYIVWIVPYPKINKLHVPVLIPVLLRQRNDIQREERNEEENLSFSSSHHNNFS